MLKKITSKNNFIFLFLDVPHEKRNSLGIASGESVLLSIYENDSFYFTTDINLIDYDSILKFEEPTVLESKFFELIKSEKEVKYTKSIVNEYEIGKYIHYLPKIKYTQKILDNHIIIRGEIKYPDNIYGRDIPTVFLDDEIIPLIDNSFFEYSIRNDNTISKLDFKLDLPKQMVTRSYKLKK